MVTVCLQCGGNGFAVAFVRCRGCKLHVIHRYCLHPMPGFKELVVWFCEDCEPKFERLSQSKKHPISVKGSDYATLQKVPSLEKESVPSLTMQRLEINSSLPNGVVPSSTNGTEDVEEARKKRLKRDEEGKDSLCDVQPLGVSSCMSGEKDKELRSCNGFEKDVIVEQAELSTGKECDEISDSDEKREGHKELKIDAQNEAPLPNSQPPEAGCRKVGEKDKGFRRCNSIQEEAMVDQAEPLTSEKNFEICDTNGKHERRKRLKKDEEYEGSLCDLPSLEVNICKDGEQDKGLGKRNHMHEEEMVEQTECLTAEDCLETFEASPRGSEPLEVNSCNAGEQGEELGRCNNMEEETMVERSEPLRSKDSPVVDCEMPLQTLPCEDMEIEHAVQNERNEGNQCNEPDRNNSVDNQPVVPDAPVELMHTVCALPIKDPSWRGSLSVTARVFGASTQLVAHLSSLACTRVTEATKSLPKLLSTDLFPRLDVWPKGFQNCSPDGSSIALYFFPDSERNEKIYNKLVQRMINQDLGIKSVLKDAELLIFASTMLPEEYRKFQEKEYLWGVFRAKQPSNVACDISNQKCHPETPNTNTPSPITMSESVANQLNRWRVILEKEKLSNTNFLNWFKILRIVLRTVKMLYVLERPIPDEPALTSSQAEKDAFRKHRDDASHVVRLMLSTMEPELRRQHENLTAFDMIGRLKVMFKAQISRERCEIYKALFRCKMVEGTPVGRHVLNMIDHVETLECLGFPLRKEVAVDVVLQSLPESFSEFVKNYIKHSLDKSLGELLNMLLTAERNILNAKSTVSTVDKVANNYNAKFVANPSNRVSKPPTHVAGKKTKPVEDASCFHCNVKGHWKRNCPKYLEDIVKTQVRPNHPTRVPQPKGKTIKWANEDECFHCKVKGHWKRNCPKYFELAKAKRSKASTSGTI